MPGRHVVRFDEYAILDPQPIAWPGHQNPVWYVENIKDLGIVPDNLNWVAIPARTGELTQGRGIENRAGCRNAVRIVLDRIDRITQVPQNRRSPYKRHRAAGVR